MATELVVVPPAANPVSKPRSAQDKKLANDLSLAEQIILAAQGDVEAATLLAEGGYTPETLQAGMVLQQAAMQAFIARQEADAQQIAATQAFNAADKAAHVTYTKLRGLGKSAFMKDPVGRTALGLDGAEPKDQQRFLTAVTALVDRGQDEAYAAQLTRKGVTPAKLTDLAQKLTAWKQLDQSQNAAMVACTQATANRDAAAKALNEWLAEYKQFARTQFKDQPAIAKRLLL